MAQNIAATPKRLVVRMRDDNSGVAGSRLIHWDRCHSLFWRASEPQLNAFCFGRGQGETADQGHYGESFCRVDVTPVSIARPKRTIAPTEIQAAAIWSNAAQEISPPIKIRRPIM